MNSGMSDETKAEQNYNSTSADSQAMLFTNALVGSSTMSNRKVISKNGVPTKPNKTGKATAADTVYTKDETAEWIVSYFKPSGFILDAAAGQNAFYKYFEHLGAWRCEILDELDFFDWNKPVDWIITNPPYSIYDSFLEHAFKVADNVVFFVPIAKAFKSNKIQQMVIEYGGLKEIVYMGGGSKHGFAFGFPVGCLHYQRGYTGDTKITYEFERW